MRLDDVFDTCGQDGADNKKQWERLPLHLKYFIESTQKMIMQKIKNKVLQDYGENGLKSLVKTSGFRSITTNSRVGGVADSLHLFGCAIDFARVGIFKENPIPTCCNLQCIEESNHWHVQLRRP